MPHYSVSCQACDNVGTIKMTFTEYDAVKAGTSNATCPHCGGWANIVFNPGDVSFVLKDGSVGGFTSKAGKENAFRAKHNKVMDKRMKDHAPTTRLNPNFGGQLTHNWKDAKDAAYEHTYDKVKQEYGSQVAAIAAKESASTYEPLVNREVSK